MMRTALLVFSLLLSVAAALANPAEHTEALDIGSRLEPPTRPRALASVATGAQLPT